MIMNKRTFSKEEKLQILREAAENGINPTIEKYGIFRASFFTWKKKFEQMGEEGFIRGMTPSHVKRIRELEKENLALKKLLAEKELEGHLKSELLKKKFAMERRGKS